MIFICIHGIRIRLELMKTLNKVGERGREIIPRLIIMGDERSLFTFMTLLVFYLVP